MNERTYVRIISITVARFLCLLLWLAKIDTRVSFFFWKKFFFPLPCINRVYNMCMAMSTRGLRSFGVFWVGFQQMITRYLLKCHWLSKTQSRTTRVEKKKKKKQKYTIHIQSFAFGYRSLCEHHVCGHSKSEVFFHLPFSRLLPTSSSSSSLSTLLLAQLLLLLLVLLLLIVAVELKPFHSLFSLLCVDYLFIPYNTGIV